MSWTRFLLPLPLLLAGATALATSADGEEARVANEGGIGTWWRLADGVVIAAPGYPEASLAQRIDACLAVGYTIQPDGSTSDPVIVKRWSNAANDDAVAWDQFGQAASSALSQWRFASTGVGVSRPTFTVATFTFVGGAQAPQGLAQHCKVADVRDALLAARNDAYERGSLNREWLDRVYRETIPREMRANQANQCRRSSATSCVN